MRHLRLAAATAAVLALGLGAAPAAHAQRWAALEPADGPLPAPRQHAAAVYDPVGHRLVVFGGRGAAGNLGDLWAFDLAARRWTELTPASGAAPAPRLTPNGVYDPHAHALLIWSGQGSGFYNDAWSFSLSAGAWTELEPPAPRPAVRYGTASIWDQLARNVVAFAGFTDQGRFDDAWRLDPAQAAWTDVSPAGARPPRRCLHTASYDAKRHRYLLYGGQQSGALDDAWAFDLATHAWSNLEPAGRPAGRYFAVSAYDARNDRLVVFGGRRSVGGVTNEVWALDLQANAWQALEPSGAAPMPRDGAAGIYVEAEDRLVVFGGAGPNFLGDVWALEELSASAPGATPSPTPLPIPAPAVSPGLPALAGVLALMAAGAAALAGRLGGERAAASRPARR